MPDDLYERDALLWSEQQAGLLTRLSQGERVNDAIDWANLIDEVYDMGRSELRACTSLLRQAIIHLMKSAAWPESSSIADWAVELSIFLADASEAFTPSMRQRIDLDHLYAKALRTLAQARDESGAARPLVGRPPWSLDELFAGDLQMLTGRLQAEPGSR